MKTKTVIVINGKGGVGKDAFCEAAAQSFKVRNVSSITPVKEIAHQCGWNGQKDLRSRKFLSDLKQLLTDYNDLPSAYLEQEYQKFLDGDDDILFVHIREPEQIKSFLMGRICDKFARKYTLLVKSSRVDKQEFGNSSDDLVEAYDYDLVFHNNGSLDDLPQAVHSFLAPLIYDSSSAHEVVPLDFHERCLALEVNKRIEAERKLAEYKEAEEQGLLLKLPCKLGARVYQVFKEPTSARNVPPCNIPCSSDLHGTCHYWSNNQCNCPEAMFHTETVQTGIYADSFRYDMIHNFGLTMFADPSEAEQAAKVWLEQGWDALEEWRESRKNH